MDFSPSYLQNPSCFKVILASLVLLILSAGPGNASSTADIYFVIHIKGSAVNKTTGKTIEVGDPISSEDEVKFGSKETTVVIIGAKGKFTLSPAVNANQTSELFAFVQNALLPLKSNGHLSSRGTTAEKVSDLKDYFGTSGFLIIGDQLRIPLNASRYPLSAGKMLIYRYTHEGEVVSKRIENHGDTIAIEKKSLYTIKGVSIDPLKIDKADIYFFDTENKKSNKVVTFAPLFIEEKILKKELTVLKEYLKQQGIDNDQIRKDLLIFVNDIYGKTDETILDRWITDHLSDE